MPILIFVDHLLTFIMMIWIGMEIFNFLLFYVMLNILIIGIGFLVFGNRVVKALNHSDANSLSPQERRRRRNFSKRIRVLGIFVIVFDIMGALGVFAQKSGKPGELIRIPLFLSMCSIVSSTASSCIRAPKHETRSISSRIISSKKSAKPSMFNKKTAAVVPAGAATTATSGS